MGARKPDELHHLFETAFNDGNMDAIMALYESEAALVPQPGQITRGHTAIRHSLQQFLALKGALKMKSVFVIHGPGIALLRSQWQIDGVGPDGKPIEMVGQSVEVVRQQPSGEWLFVIDHPFGAD